MRIPIAIALDVDSLQQAIAHTSSLANSVAMIKIGLQSYLRDGNAGVQAISAELNGAELFLDLKLHDIPQTVAGAVRSIKKLAPNVLTVHAAGGAAMLKAAVETAEDIDIAAVTVLTSLGDSDVSVFSNKSIPDLVLRLAEQAVTAGCRAIVCSPHEVVKLREAVGSEIRLIVPGVRMPGDDAGDQNRIATPAQAMAYGADILVMGRSILNAADPIAQLELIAHSLRDEQ